MKINLYIEKNDFDNFFIWLNRLKMGVLEPCPIEYHLQQNVLERPLQVLLNPDEFAIIQDAERNMEDIKNTWGDLDVLYKPQSLDKDKIMIGDIIRNATRYDLQVEIMNTAVELAMAIPGLTPLDAFLIAEREWLKTQPTE